MAEIRFHHISLTCRDPLATERFYTRYFGFMRARVVQVGDGQIVFIRNREMYFELFQATAEAPVAPADNDGYPWPSVRNVSFMVDDVDAAQIEAVGDAAGDDVGEDAREGVLGEARQDALELLGNLAQVLRIHGAEAVGGSEVGAGLGAEDDGG